METEIRIEEKEEHSKIAVTLSKAPESIIFLAPAPPSSAGWKTRTIVPYLDSKIMNLLGIHERG